jgi:putative molybdopterin biosynthesis protein
MVRRDEKIKCRVKEFRQVRGWSQEELATRMSLRRQAVYDIESGRYLPNTAVALRLAREFGCKVEDLFQAESPPQTEPVHVIGGGRPSSPRLALGRVRGRLVGMPLEGCAAMTYGFHSAHGLLTSKGETAQLLCTPDQVEKSVLLLGCDPAFEILSHHVARLDPESRVHCRFASSLSALNGLAEGMAHLAGTHLHNVDQNESNVVMAGQKLAGAGGQVVGFSLLEEGLMVSKGNPKEIRGVVDLARPEVHLVNREPGAALRVLLDDHLRRAGVPPLAVAGYFTEVTSHQEGAYRVLCGVADAALGLRAIAEVYGLDFVSIAAARCDLVIPGDMLDHPTIKIILDVLQSAALGLELAAIPGYDAGVTGKMIATL